MKKFLTVFLSLILAMNLMASVSLARNDNTNIEIIENPDNNLTNLREKNDLLRDENERLREEIRRLSQKINKGEAEKIPILMYHHVIKQKDIDKFGWENNSSVLSVEAFEEQMKYLYDNDFYIASLEELELFLDHKLSLPRKTVVISFDDGYLSNAIYAYPILQKYNFRSSIFMIGYRVDAPQIGFDPSDTQALSISEAYKYTDVFGYESHTYRMHDFDKNRKPLLTSASDQAIKRDLLQNKKLLNAKYLAYPYGRYNDRTIRLAQATGHRLGFTINRGYATRNTHKFKLPRNAIGPSLSMEEFKKLVNLKANIK